MPCWLYSTNTPPERVTSDGRSASAAGAALHSTLYGPPPTMSYSCYTVLNVGGHAWTPIARHGAARCLILTEKPQIYIITPTSPLSVVLSATCERSRSQQSNPFSRAQGEPPRVYDFIHLGPPGRLSRTPRRHDHGGILSPRAQMPTPEAFAACSARARCKSLGSYRRYHHAQPAATMARLQSSPAPFTTRTTSRPQASPFNSVTSNGPNARSATRKRRAPRNPTCPCSGASIPYRRPRTTTPYGLTKSTVSPSCTCFTNQ